MNRSIFRPLEKWILGIVYGVALTSALATLVGAIHPLASERPPRAIVQAARSAAHPDVRARVVNAYRKRPRGRESVSRLRRPATSVAR